MDGVPLKRCCSVCGKELELNPLNFRRKKAGYMGYDSCCKPCAYQRDKTSRAKKPEKYEHMSRDYCRRNADRLRAYRQERNRDPEVIARRREYAREYIRTHAEEISARSKAYHARRRAEGYVPPKRDPEYTRAALRRSYAKHREERTRATREWQRKNADRWRATKREWYRRNPEKALASFHRYHAQKKALPATFTADDWKSCLEWWNGVCAYCGSQQSFFHPLEQEHFIPVTANGAYTPENIICACKSCNTSKSDTPALEWLTRKYSAKKAAVIVARILAYFDHVKSREDAA